MSYETEAFGRYLIKSGPLNETWAANAFLERTVVAKATGASREEAVVAVKRDLDERRRTEDAGRDADGAPGADVYERALARLLPDMPDSYHAMLRAHLAAPDQLISATDLARAAGYAGYEGANLHDGKLAQRVADEVGFVLPERADGPPIWTFAIAQDPGDEGVVEDRPADGDTPHFRWRMRPQVAAALRALGW